VIRHHPSSEILSDWARGSLHAGARLAVGCHVYACANCREEAALWESVGGELLDGIAPVAMSDLALVRTLARLDGATKPDAVVDVNRAPAFLRRFDPPAPLLRQEIGMRRWITPGIWFAPIAIQPGSPARTYLVFARRNTTMSMHTHVGREFTCILYGSFSDATGTYGPGDFAETDDAIVHAPAVTADSDCLCLASADAPMRLVGLPARVIQTMTGTLY
jgi:putative transcriptional regulator